MFQNVLYPWFPQDEATHCSHVITLVYTNFRCYYSLDNKAHHCVLSMFNKFQLLRKHGGNNGYFITSLRINNESYIISNRYSSVINIFNTRLYSEFKHQIVSRYEFSSSKFCDINFKYSLPTILWDCNIDRVLT